MLNISKVPKYLNLAKNLLLKKNIPISLIIFLTNRCNARCSFCFIDFDDGFTQNKKNELSIEEYKKLAKNLGKDLHHLNFTGGEPFLRSDFGDIVKSFYQYCKISSIQISSNGSYPKRISKFIQDICKPHKNINFVFQFSIDSFPDKHNKIRKIPGLFDRTIESFEIVKNSFKNCIAACNLVVSESNYFEIIEIYEYLTTKMKIETINPIIVRDEGVYKTDPDLKQKILDAYKKLTQKIVEDIKSKKIRGFKNFSLEGAFLNGKNELAYDLISSSYIKPNFTTYCVAGKIFGVIGSDGSVYPCEILNKKLGNLRDVDFDLKKIWKNKQSTDTRKWIKDTKCTCHWECIYSYNIISNKKQISNTIKKSIKYL